MVVLLHEDDRPRGHSAGRGRAAEVARGLGLEPTQTFGTALFGFAASVPRGRVEALRRNPRVRSVQPDGIASAGPFADTGAPAGNDGGNGKGKPQPPEPEDPCASEPTQGEGWGLAHVGGSRDGTGRTVWVLDSGVDFDHCDLVVDVARSANFIFDYFTGNGKKRQPPTADDRNGHGTKVAGVVAAIDNEIGALGVAAGATVVPVRVLGLNATGSWSAIAAGVDYVAANAAPGDVANMSLSGSTHHDFVDEAILNAASLGILFTIAAGNQAEHASTREPAHVEHPNVFTVSAIDSTGMLTSFSNYGSPPIDFAAPGLGIYTTQMGGGVVTSSYGTSFSAPHVAGILLVQGFVNSGGLAGGDPDGDPDPMATW